MYVNKTFHNVVIFFAVSLAMICNARIIRVIDQEGVPVSCAWVYIREWDFIPWRYGFYSADMYLTQSNGCVKVKECWGARIMVGAYGFWPEIANKIHGNRITVQLTSITSPPPYQLTLYRIADTVQRKRPLLVKQWEAYENETRKILINYMKNGGEWSSSEVSGIKEWDP